MTDKLIEQAKFVQQLFRECDAIQLPHKPTEEVLTGMIDQILADEQVIKAAEAMAEAVDHQREMVCQDMGMQLDAIKAVDDTLDDFHRAMQRRKGGE